MAANPLTYQEIEAFTRLERVDLRPWEVEVLCRIDDAVLGVWANESRPSTGASVKDPEAVRSVMQSVIARKRAQQLRKTGGEGK
jgi:hypothetical protein